MKRLLYLLLFIPLLFAGCKDDDPAAEINLSKPDISFEDGASGQTVTFSANYEWTAESSKTWLRVSPADGPAGQATITLNADANETYDDREATVTINSRDARETIAVLQKKMNALLVTADKYQFPNEGGTLNVEIKSNIGSATYTISTDATDWIIPTGTRGLSTSNRAFTIKANPKHDKRSGRITFTANENGRELSETVEIFQAEKTDLILSDDEVNVDNEGGSFTVDLQTNVDYEVVFESGVDWVKRVEVRSLRTDKIDFIVEPNDDPTGQYSSRSTKITFKDKNSSLSSVLTVHQAQKDALILTAKTIYVNSDGKLTDEGGAITGDGKIAVELKRNVDYDILPSKEWLRQAPKVRSLVTDNVELIVDPYGSFGTRTATVTFKDKESDVEDILTVIQSGTLLFTLSETEFGVPATGGTVGVSIDTNIEYAATIRAADTGWISQATKEGNSYTYTIRPNTVVAERTGMIIFAATDEGLENVKDTVLVRQAAAEITLAVTPAKLDLDGTQQTKAIVVTTNAASWDYEVTPKAAKGWYTVTTEENTLQVSVARNTDAEREATIVITAGDKSVNIPVKQAKEEEITLSVSPTSLDLDGTQQTKTITVTTNAESWSHTVNYTNGTGWCTATKAGNTIQVSIGQNTDAQRKATIVVTAGGKNVEIPVTQAKLDVALTVTPGELNPDMRTNVQYLTVTTTETDWDVSVAGTNVDWCTATKETGRIKVRTTTNTTTSTREATVKVTAGNTTQDVTVTQGAYDNVTYYADGEVVKLKTASAFGSNTKGINIIVSGDGYTVDQMQRGNGKFYQDMTAAWQNFLSIPPYTDYADYFNVYMIAAVSNEAGMSSPSKDVDTKFESVWEGPGSTGVSCNYSFVVDSWVRKVTELSSVSLNDMTMIMPINEDQYAGTCLMYFQGFSISMCPVESASGAFRKLVCHEAGGHGFGQLLDEYIYSDSAMPEELKTSLQQRKQQYGMYANIDFSADVMNTTWSGYKTHPEPSVVAKYSMVGTFEGGYMYRYGIWRPESNSCMNNNVLYFNAPSRWAIVSRISRIAGLGITFNNYITGEVIPPNPYPSYNPNYVEQPFVPLGKPVFMNQDLSGK